MSEKRTFISLFRSFSLLCGFVSLWSATSLKAQQKTASDSLFVEYLLEKKYYNDVLQWTKSSQTLPYFRAIAFYNQQQIDSAIHYFEKVPIQHPYYIKSRFLEEFGHTFSKRYPKADSILSNLTVVDSLHIALKNLQLAGVSLLRRDTVRFSAYKAQFSGKYFAFSQEEETMSRNYEMLRKHKGKSPVVAGLMSAIIPGSGKMYAGKLGQGVITLIQNAALGFQAYEAYRKDGWKSPRFFLYSGLFSFFYVGNIWGSVLTVNIRRQEFNDKIDEQILFNMQIPLRTVFNQ
jgi:tetratricopeptide (TPR) repeat protein